MVYYRPLCLYVSEETLSIAGFSNLEGSHSMTFDVKGGEGAIYHGCFLNYFNKNSEFDFLNIVVIGVRRKDNQKIDYYFGTYHRKTNDINDSLEVEELKKNSKDFIRRKNRIALRDLESRIERELKKLEN